MAAVLLLLYGIVGCDAAQTEPRLQSRLIDLRQERTDLLDELFSDYGGHSVAQSINEALEAPAEGSEEADPGTMAEIAKGLVREGDRALFEARVRSAGSGERIIAISTKAREFFDSSKVKRECRSIVELEHRIEQLERRLDRMQR